MRSGEVAPQSEGAESVHRCVPLDTANLGPHVVATTLFFDMVSKPVAVPGVFKQLRLSMTWCRAIWDWTAPLCLLFIVTLLIVVTVRP